jgi:hypothetical protein
MNSNNKTDLLFTSKSGDNSVFSNVLLSYMKEEGVTFYQGKVIAGRKAAAWAAQSKARLERSATGHLIVVVDSWSRAYVTDLAI